MRGLLANSLMLSLCTALIKMDKTQILKMGSDQVWNVRFFSEMGFLGKLQEIFRGKQLFLDKVSSAKNLLHGYRENEWQGCLREDYKIVDPNVK